MRWWRVDTGFPRHSYTAAAIIRFERDELGNRVDISCDILNQLEHVSGNNLIWVCRRQRDACRYGNPESLDIAQSSVLAEDGDGGTLLWMHQEMSLMHSFSLRETHEVCFDLTIPVAHEKYIFATGDASPAMIQFRRHIGPLPVPIQG